MDDARRALEHYRRDLAALLTALDSDAEPESLAALERSFSSSFEEAAQALTSAGPTGRDALSAELADLRRLAALSQAKAKDEHARVGEELTRVARARRVLRDAEYHGRASHGTGDACDMRG